MITGPRDYEIAEIGLDNALEAIIPGGDSGPNDESNDGERETDEGESGIDDPLGW